MQQGITKATAEAGSSWMNMLISIGESLEVFTIPLLETIKAFADFVKERPRLAKFIGMFMLISTVVLTIVTVVGVLLGVAAGIATVTGILLSTLGTVAGVIAAIVLGVALVYAWWGKIYAFTVKYGELIKGISAVILVALAAIFVGPITALVVVGAYIVDQWETIWGWIKKVGELFSDLWGGVKDFLGFGEAKAELSSTMTHVGDLGTSNNVTVESIISGSIDVNDRTGGMVSSSSAGGDIPINITADPGYRG